MSNSPSLPPWAATIGTLLIGALLAFHVIYDALAKSYSNPTLSLALLGAFGMALGFRNTLTGGGGSNGSR